MVKFQAVFSDKYSAKIDKLAGKYMKKRILLEKLIDDEIERNKGDAKTCLE